MRKGYNYMYEEIRAYIQSEPRALTAKDIHVRFPDSSIHSLCGSLSRCVMLNTGIKKKRVKRISYFGTSQQLRSI